MKTHTIAEQKTANKAAVCNALRAFIAQRSGIDFRDYWSGDYWNARSEAKEAFNGDYRPMLRHGRQAREMLRSVELRDSITAENIISAASAFSGRLEFKIREDGFVGVDYTVGQYFPTEYRRAACAVLARCLHEYFLQNMPKETNATPLGYIRSCAARELGRGIDAEWFS